MPQTADKSGSVRPNRLQPEPTRPDSSGDAACAERIVRRSGTSFFWGMRLLPADKRAAMYAIYAFCREVDDIADDHGVGPAKRGRLNEWREEIERVYHGMPHRPVARALHSCLSRFDLPKQDFFAIIEGMEMDAGDGLRIRDMDQLRLYCDRVACAVGRLSVRVFGLIQPTGDELADAQGRALQLTNILRDLKDDAARNRLYLPADRLQAHGIDGGHPDAVLAHPAITAVCEELADLARTHFVKAAEILAGCNRRQVRPARVMMEMYRRILRALSSRGWQRLAEPVALPRAEKLWVVVRHGLL